MKAGFFSRASHHIDELRFAKRRHGVFPSARSFENIAVRIDLALKDLRLYPRLRFHTRWCRNKVRISSTNGQSSTVEPAGIALAP